MLVELFAADEAPDVRRSLLDVIPIHRAVLVRETSSIFSKSEIPNPLNCHPSSRKRFRRRDGTKDIVQVEDSNYRVVSVLGQGSVGRTFKLEQLDSDGEPIGTFVGKAVFNPDLGPVSLAAYQRLRPLSLREGL